MAHEKSAESIQKQAAARFQQMAALLELLGESRFKVNALAKASRTLEAFSGDFARIQTDLGELTKLDGIGKGTAERIKELAETGAIGEHDELAAQVPAGLLQVLEVPGLGPKTVKLMWDQLNVESITDLERILTSGEILNLPRMGEKAAEKIRESLRYAKDAGRRYPVGIARPFAESLVAMLRELEHVQAAQYTGSMRRGRDTVGDIDIVCVCEPAVHAHEALRSHSGVRSVLAAGETKTSVRMHLRADMGRWKGILSADEMTIQVDLRTVPSESWGAALMYFTGSKEHNVRLRERAQRQGLTLNEYGLYPDDSDAGSDSSPPQSRGVSPTASSTEEDIFRALGLGYVEPEIREDAGEITLAESEKLPRLIEIGDIRAELHAHTTASDGRMPLEELVDRAHQRGFHTIAVTDHSKSSATAGGLNEARLAQQRAEIEALRAQRDDITILCGSEVDILADGSLDFDDETLAWLDWVVASPHAALGQKPAEATRRLIKAIENPCVHVIGHPTGRIIGRRKGLEPAMHEVIDAAIKNDVALEINAHWLRMDLNCNNVRAAVEAGCKIAIDCDVHTAACFDNLHYGVVTGRRGWLTPELCINAWDAPRLQAWIRSKRQ